jgi:hypothetical protein
MRFWLKKRETEEQDGYTLTRVTDNRLTLTMVGDNRMTVYEENGLLYFNTSTNAFMSPELKRLIARVGVGVTVEQNVPDMKIARAIQPGRYVHGRFEATVTSTVIGGCVTGINISAKAPTASLTKRWLTELLSGQDRPKVAFGAQN